MSVLGNHWCAAGQKRFQQLDPDQFRPKGEKNTLGDAWCGLCQQYTKLKEDGMFIRHKSSQQGPGVDRGQSHGKRGEPPRVRRRGK